MTTAISAGPWVSAELAAVDLGLSRASLYRLRQIGRLKAGQHYIKTTPGKTGRVLWCPNAIREAMADWSDG